MKVQGSSRILVKNLIIASAAVGLLSLSFTRDAQACWCFDGTFVAQFDMGPGCPNSPMLPPQCTHGQLTLDGGPACYSGEASYEFGFHSQSADPLNPGHLVFTGASVITLSDGGVICAKDDGDLFVDPATDHQASFETRVHPYRSCKPGVVDPCGAELPQDCKPLKPESSIVATGVLDVISNTTSGEFSGQICPK